MGKGQRADIGAETVNQNGYTCVKTSTGWRFKHHILAEQKLGRPLESDERVLFEDGDRKNLSLENIKVVIKQVRVGQTYDKRLDSLRDKMALFVVEASDHNLALEDLRGLLNDLRNVHNLAPL